MKRAFPYKVKSAAASKLPNEVLEEIPKQGHQQQGNMACCQAATLGLAALSTMGLPSILLSGGDRAIAAEPPAEPILSQEEAIGTYASQQIDVAGEAKTPKALLLQQLTREYVEGAINSTENPNEIVRNSSTVLFVGKQQKNPSFHSIELGPKAKKITRATMPSQQPNVVSKFLGTGASKSQVLGKEASSHKARQLNSQLSKMPEFQKQLKTALVGGYSPSGGERLMAESRYEGSESSSKSGETIAGKSSAKSFPEQSSGQEAGISLGAEPVEVQGEAAMVNSKTEAIANTVKQWPKITTRVEGAVIIDSESTEAPVSTFYEVRPGDTLEVIASRHGVSVEDLVKLNRLKDPNWLEVSQTLKIPQKRSLTLGEKTAGEKTAGEKTTPPNVAKTPNQSKDYGFTLPSTERPQIIDASYSISAKGSVGFVKRASWPGQGGEDLAVETKQADSAAGLEELGQSNPRKVTPTATETVEEESEIAGHDPANNPYSQRLRSEVLRLRQQYEYELELQRTNNRGSEASGDRQHHDSSEDGDTLTPEVNSQGEYEFRQPEISSPKSRDMWPSLSPGRPEIHPRGFLPGEELNSADERNALGATPEKAQEILNSSMGEMVSPELPPLEGADTYLPDGAMEFTGYILPAKGTFTSGYGWRWGRMHKGIDIAAPTGTPILAAAPGVISFAGWNSGYGYTVKIKHPDKSLTLYAHNSLILVQEGQTVAQGELIAKMGSTGRSSGPHLHFEIHPTGNGAVNPMPYLPRS